MKEAVRLWTLEPGVVGLLFGLAFYTCGVVRVWRRAGVGCGLPRWRVLLGVSAFVILGVALVSPLEALTARILPGTPDDPGAREAGIVTYIDNFLAVKDGLPEPTYREPPFAQTYQGDEPATDTDGPYKVLWIPHDQIERYGYQSMLTPRDVYRIGVAAVDRYANAQFGKDFVNTSEVQQDSVVSDMAGGNITSFDKELSAESFFHTLRRHTTEGMFADPAHGGNRNLVGWTLVGYPGAQRACLPSEIQTEGTARKPQAIADLNHFNPGQAANGEVILPVSGRDQQHSN